MIAHARRDLPRHPRWQHIKRRVFFSNLRFQFLLCEWACACWRWKLLFRRQESEMKSHLLLFYIFANIENPWTVFLLQAICDYIRGLLVEYFRSHAQQTYFKTTTNHINTWCARTIKPTIAILSIASIVPKESKTCVLQLKQPDL